MADVERILVVDDDRVVREMLAEYLSSHGYQVDCADSGAAMREAIEREPPDLVLLDLRLPDQDGPTLARYLREHYDVGIIMVTGSSETVDRVGSGLGRCSCEQGQGSHGGQGEQFLHGNLQRESGGLWDCE